jgi:hypothetical protein
MKLTAAIAIAALVVGCSSTSPGPSSAGAIGTAPPSVAPSEHAAPSASAFASDRYRYEVVLPSGWLARPAESTWTSGALEGRCPSDWDCFSDNPDDVTLAAAALAVPADLTLSQWRLRIQLSTPAVCSDSGPHTDTTLDGEPAQAWASTCSSEDLDVIKVVAIHGGQGYIVLFASTTSIGLEADRATIDAILATFRFAA